MNLEEVPYSALRILEKLREMGFDGGCSIVKAYVSSRKMDEKATVRFETMPGKQGQMDWGFFEDHPVYEDGKWKKLYCSLENGENMVFLGPPGVGKTHLASALELVAAQHRFSTYYINCHQLIARRYEKTSTVFTSNKTFSQWNEVFADVTIASAILDRVLHHCTVINIKGEKRTQGIYAPETANREYSF